MKTRSRFLRYATIAVLAISIGLTSCKRKVKDEVEPDPDLTSERDLSNGENDFNSLDADIDKALDNGASNLREEASYYATIGRKDTATNQGGTSYDKMISIVYTGTGYDGQGRSGTIYVYYTGQRISGTFKAFTTFSNTKVGGRAVSGTRKIVQQPSVDTDKWIFTITASGSVTTVDGRTMNYDASKVRVRSGVSTLSDLTDDSFSITGNWAGVNGQGETVSANISSPLTLVYGCHYFREITTGKIDFTNITKGYTRSIDFGNGGCDGKGTFINTKGKSFFFLFKR